MDNAEAIVPCLLYYGTVRLELKWLVDKFINRKWMKDIRLCSRKLWLTFFTILWNFTNQRTNQLTKKIIDCGTKWAKTCAFCEEVMLSMPAYVCSLHASCMFMWGVSGLSSQRSLMPLDPGRRLDGITGNWIVFHLLWKQPGRGTPPSSTPSLLPPHPPIPAVSYRSNPPPAPHWCTPVSIPLLRHVAPKPLLLHVIQSFPLRCRNAGLDVSRVLNKAAACTIPAKIQHSVVYHPNGVEQYA